MLFNLSAKLFCDIVFFTDTVGQSSCKLVHDQTQENYINILFSKRHFSGYGFGK